MNDSETIRSILNGNRNDFAILVEKYQQMIFRVAMGFVHEKEDAEDITQEVFINAYQSLKKFRGDSSFSTWLHRIAVNVGLNHTRKNRGVVIDKISSFFDHDRIIESELLLIEDNPEDIIIKKEHSEWLRRALDKLPKNQHTAIVLSKYDDLPQKEIADILNISEGAVEALIQRAKKNLRENLSSGIRKL